MDKEKKEKEVDIMSIMKPIQATPELSGKDAEKLLNQTNATPTEKAKKKNTMLHNVLISIRNT